MSFEIFSVSPVLLWMLLFLNALTFVLMFLDKWFAHARMRRVPERLFYLLTFLGGSLGMLLGMFLFRHKTKKLSFQLIVGILILVQIALFVWLVVPVL